MRGYGPRPDEWTVPLNDSQMAEIEKRANPPNGQILNQNVIPTLERDLRALLAEVRRLRSAEKDRYERDYSTYRMF